MLLKDTRNTCARNARGLVTSVEIEIGITNEQLMGRISDCPALLSSFFSSVVFNSVRYLHYIGHLDTFYS